MVGKTKTIERSPDHSWWNEPSRSLGGRIGFWFEKMVVFFCRSGNDRCFSSSALVPYYLAENFSLNNWWLFNAKYQGCENFVVHTSLCDSRRWRTNVPTLFFFLNCSLQYFHLKTNGLKEFWCCSRRRNCNRISRVQNQESPPLPHLRD